jgi:DNA-binding transcriptional MerR regulator
MKLKKFYSAREVAVLTGLSARQLQWWDSKRLFQPAVAPRRTEKGGFTERRYTPVDLLELMVLADLRRHGFTVGQIRRLLAALNRRFGIRLYEAIGGEGPVTLLTDGRKIFARTTSGALFNLLENADQPLLVISEEGMLRELKAREHARRRKKASAAMRRGAEAGAKAERPSEA